MYLLYRIYFGTNLILIRLSFRQILKFIIKDKIKTCAMKNNK